MFRHQLFGFASDSAPGKADAANLRHSDTIHTLAWIIRHIVPHVSVKPGAVLSSIHQKVSISQYVTNSDLAFSVLLLEHYISHWRLRLHVKLETAGESPSLHEPTDAAFGGLVYPDGIAGMQAKNRYCSLCEYFFFNLFGNVREDAANNMRRLQHILDTGAAFDDELLEAEESENFRNPPCRGSKEMTHEIYHRAFYWSRPAPSSASAAGFATPASAVGATSLKYWAKIPPPATL